MKIGYRRQSGSIALSERENGTRGIWWEKRLALLEFLKKRGHKIVFLSPFSKQTAKEWMPVTPEPPYDLLMIEFAGANLYWNEEELKKTAEIVKQHQRRVIWICDDPDLELPWKFFCDDEPRRWVAWLNTKQHKDCLRLPPGMETADAPFGCLLNFQKPKEQFEKRFVYLGRSEGGRKKILNQFFESKFPLTIIGRAEEWGNLKVEEPPPQPERKEFYSNQMGCLALADKKHKEIGWRTGRAYHALAAGCPVLVEPDHHGLGGFICFVSIEDARDYAEKWQQPYQRQLAWEEELSFIKSEREQFIKTTEAVGL